MIILDVNILLYTYNADYPQHPRVKIWFEELLTGPERVGLPMVALWAFLRISTNPRANQRPLSPAEAFNTIKELLSRPDVVIADPGTKHLEILEWMVRDAQAWGPDVTDAVLAAIAIEHGATLASADRGFSRFPNLKWINPLD